MKYVFGSLLVFFAFTLKAQDNEPMTAKKLFMVMAKEGEVKEQADNTWEIHLHNIPLITVVDETNNRMRIISPVAYEKDIKKDDMEKVLSANFHSMLDVKYALYNGYLWAIFVHPLGELSEKQVLDAMYQVITGVATYGKSYQSTDLIFGGGQEE